MSVESISSMLPQKEVKHIEPPPSFHGMLVEKPVYAGLSRVAMTEHLFACLLAEQKELSERYQIFASMLKSGQFEMETSWDPIGKVFLIKRIHLSMDEQKKQAKEEAQRKECEDVRHRERCQKEEVIKWIRKEKIALATLQLSLILAMRLLVLYPGRNGIKQICAPTDLRAVRSSASSVSNV